MMLTEFKCADVANNKQQCPLNTVMKEKYAVPKEHRNEHKARWPQLSFVSLTIEIKWTKPLPWLHNAPPYTNFN